MNRIETLDSAKKIITTDRDDQYGRPEDNFQRISIMWSAYLGVQLEAKDVAAMMIMLKTARIASGHNKDDNWIDICGYAACGCEVETINERRKTQY